MKHRRLHILLIGAVFLSLTACTREGKNTELCPDEKVKVVFTLALDNNAQSRAPGDWTPGDYDPSELGDGYENHIELGSLQVALYNTDNTFLTNVENLSYYQTGQINVYRFVGEVQVNKFQNNNLNCKVMVLANVSNTLDDAANFSEFSFTRANTYIPLWGVKTVNAALAPNTYTDLGVIYLLRAIAKVEVILSDEVANNYTLASVSFDRYNDKGYCLPTGYNTTANTEDLSVEGCLRIPTQTVVSTPLAFQKDANNARRFFIYVPEFQNVGVVNDAQSSLTVTLQPVNTEEEKTYTIKFAEYGEDGKLTATALNVVRNHLYRFLITNVTVFESGNTKTDIYTRVLPWRVVDLTPGYE